MSHKYIYPKWDLNIFNPTVSTFKDKWLMNGESIPPSNNMTMKMWVILLTTTIEKWNLSKIFALFPKEITASIGVVPFSYN